MKDVSSQAKYWNDLLREALLKSSKPIVNAEQLAVEIVPMTKAQNKEDQWLMFSRLIDMARRVLEFYKDQSPDQMELINGFQNRYAVGGGDFKLLSYMSPVDLDYAGRLRQKEARGKLAESDKLFDLRDEVVAADCKTVGEYWNKMEVQKND